MKSPFICSYIIAYTHSHRNLKILKDNLNQIIKDHRIQIIIVEVGDNPHLQYHDLRSKHVFLESDTYNLGWIFNCGHRYATTDHLFFSDLKYHPKLEVIHSILNDGGERHCIYLQDSIGEMTQEQTDGRQNQMGIKTIPSDNRGIVYYTKDGILTVGGFDENVFGDDFWKLQEKRNKAVLNVGKVNGNGTVQFYTDGIPLNGELIEYSSKHYEKVSDLDPQRMVSYIRGQQKKIANPLKYKKIELMNP